MSEGSHYTFEHPKTCKCQEDDSSLKADKYYAKH